MGDRVILHSDINCCYASIEHLHHPELAGKPLAVGGDPEARHGIVLTADYIAKKYGVKTGMALWQAKQVCPDITFVSPRMDLYLRFSRMAHEIYAEYTDRQEPYGIDECWLDVTGSSSLKGDGLLIAQEISRRMKSELGITVSVGVSFNKIFAKLGSDYKKPDAITTMYKSEFKQKAWSLPVADLLYVGKSTNRKLALFGIKTIGDLARADEDVLNSHLGKMGSILWSFANGYDDSPVKLENTHAPIKSVGNSTTTPKDLVCDEDVKIVLYILAGIGINNSSVASKGSIIGGNSTDRALMSFLVDAKATSELSREDVRNFNAFDSNKKSSSITLTRDGQSTTYIKGAPERIVEKCKYYIDETGTVKELVEKNYLTTYIDTQAGRSMRLLAVAKTNGTNEDGELTLICVISIRDNVRKEAVNAIKEVQNAGIQVVMVTGDRKETAVAIAKEAGLLTDENDVALTSAEMADKSDDELKKILPRLKVVSRALPTDKSRLVRIAQELDYVVGMTGDGVNDSPALKKADVGFAMGSGTEVAKEAGDITILDDNFSSIEKAILYGRTMFKSIRKFLIFQLTVNVAAVLTCFIGPLFGENVILTVIQLLLINLAMDTLAAIAFGSEPALKEYMNDKPVPRTASIVSKEMLTEVIISALYITFICLAILFISPVRNLFGNVDVTYLKSALFATFMMAITFNGFNARTSHINVFESLGRNKNFLLVIGAIFLMQFVFVTFGGDVLSVESLSVQSWIVCIVLAFLVIPIDMIRKVIMRKN